MSDEKRIRASLYRVASGAEPARDWLLGMADEGRRTIGYNIATAEFGWPVGMPTWQPMRQGLYEIRSSLAGNSTSRIFFCVAGGRLLLLHGMIKKTRLRQRSTSTSPANA